MEKCRPHPLLTLAERPYLGHCESTSKQQDKLNPHVDLDFYLMRMRIQVTKIIRIRLRIQIFI